MTVSSLTRTGVPSPLLPFRSTLYRAAFRTPRRDAFRPRFYTFVFYSTRSGRENAPTVLIGGGS